MTAVSETATDPAAASWRAVSASRRGSSHAADVPNQDAARCEQVAGSDGARLWVAAVADGHGGARYVRSDVGARAAVDVALDAVRQALDAGAGRDLSALLRTQVPRIVEAWRAAVRAHAAAHPYSQEEHVRAGGDPRGGDGLVAYGATLLLAVVGEEGVAVAQVGDGDALVRSHGFATRPVPGDERLVAGETTSLCLTTAVDDFRYAFVPASAEPDLVLLATDGYGNSFAQASWWQGLLGDVASFVERLGFHQLEEQLPDWLEESARVGGDDVSAVVVVREPLAVEAPTAAASVPDTRDAPHAPDAPDGQTRPRTLELPGGEPGRLRTAGAGADAPARRRPVRRWRTPLLALLAIALAVLGVIAVLLLLGPDSPESPVDVPTDRTSTTPPAGEDTADVTGKNDGKDNKKKSRNDKADKTDPDLRQNPGSGSADPPAQTGNEAAPKPLGSG